MDLRQIIKDFLKEASLMQLATSIDNNPWICSVWFTADDDFNIYWFSSTTRRHSEEIAKNPKVAVAIVVPQTPKDLSRGLQIDGIAKLLTDQKEIDKAISIYEGRVFTKDKIKELTENPEKPHRFYKLIPKQFVLLDALNFPQSPRQEYSP